MDTILFLAHTEADGALPRAAYEALTATRDLTSALGGGSFAVGLVGADVGSAADSLAASGVGTLMAVTGPGFGQSRYVSDAAAAEAICRAAGATVVLAPATSRWSRVLPGVACRLAGRIDSHVTSVSGSGGTIRVNRWYYRQRMEAVVQRTTRPWMILIDAGCFPAWSGSPSKAAFEILPVDLPPEVCRTTVTGVVAPAADLQTIRPDAALLLVAGAGWTKKQVDGHVHAEEAASLILEFLRLTQASLGGSKSLVDLSGVGQKVLLFLTHLNQIGQTGSTPRHPRGLSTCCHGEEPHVVGWRFVSERRAINLDANCGWARGKADVVYVADAFDLMSKVNALLAARAGGPA
jgi:electron transfer flavoprotein alpha subunit